MGNPKVNIEQFFVRDNTCTYGDKIWEASTLFKASKDLQCYDLQLSALNLDTPFPTSDTMALFAYQMKSVNPFYICTTISETKDHSVDFNYPYVVVDSYRFIKLNP